MIKSNGAIKAEVVASQFGLKLVGCRIPMSLLVNRAKVDVLTSEDPEDGKVQRDTSTTRKNKLKKDLLELTAMMKGGGELITENFHIVIQNTKRAFRLGELVNLTELLRDSHTYVSIKDGAGRFWSLDELIRTDSSWANLLVYVQFYLNPSAADEIRLMEILNGKRARLEPNFGVSLRSRFYTVSTTGIEGRHVLSNLAVRLATDKSSPLLGRTKFSYTTEDGLDLSAIEAGIKVALREVKITESNVLRQDYDELYMLLRGSTRALAACTDDLIFSDAEWPKWVRGGAGAMFKTMLTGMMIGAVKILNAEPDISERVLIQCLVARYGAVARAFVVQSQATRFTKLGGAGGITRYAAPFYALMSKA